MPKPKKSPSKKKNVIERFNPPAGKSTHNGIPIWAGYIRFDSNMKEIKNDRE
jgi:hypothetical protein